MLSTDLSVVNTMLVDGGRNCISLLNYYGGIQYNDFACTDNSYINTVCEFEGSTLSPTSKFLFVINHEKILSDYRERGKISGKYNCLIWEL